MKAFFSILAVVLLAFVAITLMSTPAYAATATYSWVGSSAIGQGNEGCQTISVPIAASITDLNVEVAVNFFQVGSLTYTLTSPSGSVLTLMNRPGFGGGGIGNQGVLIDTNPLTFDDSATSSAEAIGPVNFPDLTIPAGTFYPFPDGGSGTNLAQYNNANVQGDWQLCVTATPYSGIVTSFTRWSMIVSSPDIQPPAVPTSLPVPPAPPPADPLASEMNFNAQSSVRASVPDELRASVNVRTIVADGQYPTWNGAQQSSAATLGNQGVVDLGVLQAVNVYSPTGMSQFAQGVVICLRGEGYMLWKPDGSVTNQYFWIETYTVDEFPGFTCITVFQPGILALVQTQPDAP